MTGTMQRRAFTRRVFGRHIAAAALAYASRPLAALAEDAIPDHDDLTLRVERSLRTSGLPMMIADRMDRYEVHGVSLAVAYGDRIAWARGYGHAHDLVPVGPRTLFQACSISKPVTAAAALRLADRGVLDLDRDVNDYLKTWRIPDTKLTRSQPVTVRLLMGHRAGIGVHGFPGYAADARLPTLTEILDGLPPANTPRGDCWPKGDGSVKCGPAQAIRVETEPGGRVQYSGGGYTILQQLLIDVTGEMFPVLMRRLVLDPCGMRDSDYLQPLPPSRAAAAAHAHYDDGTPVPGSWHVYPELAAAGLWTTPVDLLRFAIEIQRAHAGRPGALMRQATAAAMLTPQVGAAGYGMGFHILRGGIRFQHAGGNLGFKCLLVADTVGGRGFAVMTNGDNGEPLCTEIRNAVLETYDWPRFR